MKKILVAVLVVAGCGGQSAPKADAPKTEASSAPKPAASLDDEDGITPEVKAQVAAAVPVVHNADGSITLENLLKLGAPASDFPKSTTADAECTKALSISGESAKDYSTITGKCGAPTGLKEYVKTVTGKFDATHTHDTYVFKMAGGFCYRFFAVADSTVKTIDIRVQRPEGALISVATSKNFVAIMNPDGVWCKTHDREFRLVVETGGGQGNYTFGVWARPKP